MTLQEEIIWGHLEVLQVKLDHCAKISNDWGTAHKNILQINKKNIK